MSPADITAGAEFRAGLARRLTEVGLIGPEPAPLRVAAAPGSPVEPAGEDRRAA